MFSWRRSPIADTIPANWKEASDRIDSVLSRNNKLEVLFIVLVTILAGVSVAAAVRVLLDGHAMWLLAPVASTGLLVFPVQAVVDLRKKNILLAVTPVLISGLSTLQAAEQIQKLFEDWRG